jgi:hypothetical protein
MKKLVDFDETLPVSAWERLHPHRNRRRESTKELVVLSLDKKLMDKAREYKVHLSEVANSALTYYVNLGLYGSKRAALILAKRGKRSHIKSENAGTKRKNNRKTPRNYNGKKHCRSKL